MKKLTCNIENCNEKLQHPHYIEATGGFKHLAGYCRNHGKKFIPHIPGLDIPVHQSKELKQINARKNQISLFGGIP